MHLLCNIISLFILISFVKSSLKIFSPLSLMNRFSQNEIEISIAYFGETPWDKTLIGSLFYSNPGDACSFINPLYYDNESFPIVFAERGNCSYVKKAMFTQLIGGKMLIINDAFYEDSKDQFVGDDGNGDLINIPVIMVKKHDGDIIKEFLLSDDKNLAQSVSVSISFELAKYQKVELELWLSTSNIDSYNFVEEFHESYLKLKDNIKITPFYALWYCAYCKHNYYKIKNDNCLSGGRYCYPDPDISGPLLGRDYVKESLRQICIFQTNPEKWWDYMKSFKKKCLNTKEINNCTSLLMKKINLNASLVNSCIAKSFAGDDEDIDDNTLLKVDQEKFKNQGIQIWPSILINNVIYKGILNSGLIYEIICQSFTTPPTICVNEFEDLDNKQKNNVPLNKYNINNENNYIPIFILVFGIIAAFLLFFVMIKCKIFTRTALPNDISRSITTTISQYFAFQDKNDREKMIEVSA